MQRVALCQRWLLNQDHPRHLGGPHIKRHRFIAARCGGTAFNDAVRKIGRARLEPAQRREHLVGAVNDELSGPQDGVGRLGKLLTVEFMGL